MFTQSNLEPLNNCLACGSSNLKLTLNLNEQPLANSYKTSKDEVQPTFPLAINRCTDCYHVQLTHAVNPELMFKEYLYVSGTSMTMKAYFAWFAKYVDETYKVLNGSHANSILDIGCNDGSQLDEFKKIGYSTFGVDPAENLYQKSSQNHKVYVNYFDENFADLSKKQYSVITAQNVFAHNYNPLGFLEAAKNSMFLDSLLFVQTSQADMIANNEFDTIYHEHISFYNINSMNELCRRAGLFLLDVIKTPLHGNSYVFVISKNATMARNANIQNLIEMERKAGLLSEEKYIQYEIACKQVASDLKEMINCWHNPDMGYYTVGYGAAAKGMTLLNYTGAYLDYVIDDNPLKQGRFTPGSSVPIVSSDILDTIPGPFLFVPLAWNFFDEIKSKIKAKRNVEQDKFCIYFPTVRITK